MSAGATPRLLSSGNGNAGVSDATQYVAAA